ncbi:secretory carrier-associated membrane protein 1 isoform X1 [Diorhabda carinulata]|uniref:secretory carrier-associated membrane protein 1 isoform X1 n=1 Tax=Diorhabda carinulata TaxID=1163345 RepID=UPI0025A0BA19|nr:secretory carrier-associated membrane protein 1 isoform X1 [Diorhabda carinulata]
MSGFDENPFGEPTIDNPFADPSVQQVARSASAQLKVDDYNPFDNQAQNQTPQMSYGQSNTGPAIMQPTQEPPAYTKSGQQQAQNISKPTLDTAELQRRQEELERKEQELARREEEMRNSTYNVRRNNWPPLPEQCCFQPCFYQDIQVDIPLEFQKIVRNLYYLWIYHGALMIVNVIGGIILENVTIVGLGILYLLLFTPFGYLCWFRPAYKAFRSDSSFNFMVFFFIFFFQFVITTIQFIGIPSSGTIGIITALSTFGKTAWSIFSGIIALIIAIGFGFAAAADLFLISKIHRMYRSTGASLAKAQQEFTTEFFRSQHVRNAASNVAAAAVNSQLNQNQNNPRY